MLRNKSTLSYRKMSDADKAKLFAQIVQDTFNYLNEHQKEFTIFLEYKKDYLQVEYTNFDFQSTMFVNSIKGKNWSSNITSIKMSYKQERHIDYYNMWEHEQNLIIGNKDLFQAEPSPKMKTTILEFIQLLSWKAQKKIFKAHHIFRIKRTVGSFRRLWRILNHVLHVQFRLSYYWNGNWATLDIYTNEEFEYYKKELWKAKDNGGWPTQIHSITLRKLSPPTQTEDNGVYGSVENFFDLEKESPIKFNTTKKIRGFVKKVINKISNN